MVTAFSPPKKPRYWGGDAATQALYDRIYQDEYDRARRQWELEFFDREGFWPGQQRQVQAAQEASQAEYDQLIREIQGAIGRLDEDPISMMIRDELMARAAGEGLPYDAETLNQLVSQATAPIMRGAQGGLTQLRESMAARGLGRSGGLGSLEQQLMQEAIQKSALAGADIRGQGRLANYQARQGAISDLSGFHGGQTQARNALIAHLTNLRAQKTFDSSYFRGGRNAGYTASGAGFDYTPPPAEERRRTGTSAPKYKLTTNAWDVTGRAL